MAEKMEIINASDIKPKPRTDSAYIYQKCIYYREWEIIDKPAKGDNWHFFIAKKGEACITDSVSFDHIIERIDLYENKIETDMSPVKKVIECYSCTKAKKVLRNLSLEDTGKVFKTIGLYINKMPSRTEQILKMRLTTHFTLKEIGEMYGITANRVREIESEGLRILRRRLKVRLKVYD
ncbi:MAG: hypothetical protein IKI90_03315 [Treponema sp.]|nr:hypothetical protein [Treponema sp.]